MKVKLRRFTEEGFRIEEFDLDVSNNPTVLEILCRIKEGHDPTLSFRAMCRSAICGTCAVKINGEHRLACNTRVKGEEVLIEPVDNSQPIKDLVVSHEGVVEKLKRGFVWLLPGGENKRILPSDLKKTSRAWDCILCDICNNICPPLLEGKDFGGPMVLTKLFKIIEDPRDSKGERRFLELKSQNVQNCIHCGNCNLYCPKGCMPERWITVIEGKLIQRGYIQKRTEDFGFLGF